MHYPDACEVHEMNILQLNESPVHVEVTAGVTSNKMLNTAVGEWTMEARCHEAAGLRYHRYWFVLNQPAAIALLAFQLALQQYGEVMSSRAEGRRGGAL